MITIMLDNKSADYQKELSAMRRFIPLLKKESNNQTIKWATLNNRSDVWDRRGTVILVGNRVCKNFRFDAMNYRGSIIKKGYIKLAPVLSPLRLIRQTLEGGRYPEVFNRIFIADLKRIAIESQHAEPLALEVDSEINPSFMRVIEYLDSLAEEKFVAFDIETNPSSITHISFSCMEGHGICIPLVKKNGFENYFSLDNEFFIWERIKSILEDKDKIKIAQNGMFDATYLKRKLHINTTNIFDTMIAQHVLDPETPKDLGFLTSVYCKGRPFFKDSRKNWQDPVYTSTDNFQTYSALDSASTYEIMQAQIPLLESSGHVSQFLFTCSLIEPAIEMGELGIKVDLSLLEELKQEILNKHSHYKNLFKELTDGKIENINSTRQLANYFYNIVKHPKRKTKSGQLQIDKKTLNVFAKRKDKAALALLEYKKYEKLRSTYINLKLEEDNRLRTSFNIVGTSTGRFSSSKTIFGTGANTQNLHPLIRKAMIPDKNCVIASLDLSQAEARIVAYLAGVEEMIHTFQEDEDIHSLTASKIYKKSPKNVTYEERRKGKIANFGLMYGMGVSRFSDENTLSYHESQLIHTAYHEAYPEISEWHRSIEKELESNKLLHNMFGHVRYYRGYHKKASFTYLYSAYNYKPQSTVAHIINKLILYIYEKCTYVKMFNQIHDSVELFIPSQPNNTEGFIGALLGEIQSYSHSIILKALGREFFIPLDISLGINAGEMEEQPNFPSLSPAIKQKIK